MSVTQLQERRRTKLFIREDDFGRFVSCLVYIPRDRYNTNVRLRMADILKETFGGESVEFSARVSESALSRLQFVVRVPKGKRVRTLDRAEQDALEHRLVEVSRTWTDRLGDALRAAHGEEEGDRLMDRFGRAFPTAYEETFTVNQGVADLGHLDRLGDGTGTSVALYRPADAPDDIRRFKLFRVDPLSLTDILPIFTHMGVEVVDEQPFEVARADGTDPARLRLRAARARRRDLGGVPARPAARPLRGRGRRGLGRPRRERRLQPARARGPAHLAPGRRAPRRREVPAPDPRHLLAGLPRGRPRLPPRDRPRPRRAVAGPLRPASAYDGGRRAPSERTARRARRSPAGSSTPSTTCPRSTTTASSGPSSASSAPGCARTSTSRAPTASTRPYVSLKLNPKAVPDLPAPRPQFEIWVYSPRVEGVHLRFGPVARGGLRWSRPARGLPHRGARPGQGADGQERRHRADRLQGRVLPQAAARPRGRPRGVAGGGQGGLPDVHLRAARHHRQPGLRRGGAARARGAPRRRRRLPRRRRRQGHGHLLRHRQRGRAVLRLLARRRVRLGRLGRLRPQGDGHHRPRRLGVGQAALPRDGRRHPEPGLHRRRRRRHERRRVRQRHAAVRAHPPRRGLRPPARLHRPQPGCRGLLRRAPSPLRPPALLVGRLRQVADLRRWRGLPAHA